MAKVNTIIVLVLLAGWLISGIVLWQFKLAGPKWSNTALLTHDLLTWLGLPYIIYHSITRTKWLKDSTRRTVSATTSMKDFSGTADSLGTSGENTAAAAISTPRSDRTAATKSPEQHQKPEPVYTRRAFIRSAVGVGLAVTLGPTFVSWVGRNLSIDNSIDSMLENDPNRMSPLPQPAAASSLLLEEELKGISECTRLRPSLPFRMRIGHSGLMGLSNGHRSGIGNSSLSSRALYRSVISIV